MGAAPGVVRGAHKRFWWTFDPDAVRSAIALAEQGEEEGTLPSRSGGGRRGKEVAELQGFLTR